MSLQNESEWEQSEPFKRIVALESFARVHGWEEYKGQTVPEFISQVLSNREKEIAEEVAVTFAKSPLNKRKDKDADAFYLDVLQIIKH